MIRLHPRVCAPLLPKANVKASHSVSLAIAHRCTRTPMIFFGLGQNRLRSVLSPPIRSIMTATRYHRQRIMTLGTPQLDEAHLTPAERPNGRKLPEGWSWPDTQDRAAFKVDFDGEKLGYSRIEPIVQCISLAETLCKEINTASPRFFIWNSDDRCLWVIADRMTEPEILDALAPIDMERPESPFKLSVQFKKFPDVAKRGRQAQDILQYAEVPEGIREVVQKAVDARVVKDKAEALA